MRPLISKKSFSCIIIGSAVMSYIIKYVIEKLGDPIENIVCGAATMISITSLVFLFKLKKYIDNSINQSSTDNKEKVE